MIITVKLRAQVRERETRQVTKCAINIDYATAKEP